MLSPNISSLKGQSQWLESEEKPILPAASRRRRRSVDAETNATSQKDLCDSRQKSGTMLMMRKAEQDDDQTDCGSSRRHSCA